MLNLVVNNNFKINRKVIDKEFVKIQIAEKQLKKTYIHNFSSVITNLCLSLSVSFFPLQGGKKKKAAEE